MVNISINFKKKDLFLLSAIMIFLIGVGFVVAYGGNQPAVMGHSADELTGVCKTDGTGCPAGLGGGVGLGAFGDWVTVGTNVAGSVNYGPAETDGFVTAHAWDGHLQGYTGANSAPSKMVVRHNLYHSGSGSGITFPVKKGDYWRVETQGGDGLIDKLYWLPIVSSGSGVSSTYDSGWFSATIDQTYTKSHGLGKTPDFVQIWISDTADGSGRVVLGPYGETNAYGLKVVDIDSTNIKLRAAAFLWNGYDASGTGWQPNTAYVKIKAFNF